MSEWNFVTLFIASVFQELMYTQNISCGVLVG